MVNQGDNRNGAKDQKRISKRSATTALVAVVEKILSRVCSGLCFANLAPKSDTVYATGNAICYFASVRSVTRDFVARIRAYSKPRAAETFAMGKGVENPVQANSSRPLKNWT